MRGTAEQPENVSDAGGSELSRVKQEAQPPKHPRACPPCKHLTTNHVRVTLGGLATRFAARRRWCCCRRRRERRLSRAPPIRRECRLAYNGGQARATNRRRRCLRKTCHCAEGRMDGGDVAIVDSKAQEQRRVGVAAPMHYRAAE